MRRVVVQYHRTHQRPREKWYIERPVRETEARLEGMVRAGLTLIGLGIAIASAGAVGLCILRAIFG